MTMQNTQRRRVRRLSALALGLIGALVLTGQGRAEKGGAQTIEAGEFIVRDSAGQARITMGVYGDRPSIRLNGPKGERRLVLDLDPDGTPNVFLFDAKGRARAELVMDTGGASMLHLVDKNGQVRIDLTTHANGLPVILIRDGEGNVLWRDPLARERTDAALARCKEYYDIVMTWAMVKKAMPERLVDLEAPLTPGDAADFARIEKDPWGGEYLLETDGNKPRIRSPGPDGEIGTADDVTYPE